MKKRLIMFLMCILSLTFAIQAQDPPKKDIDTKNTEKTSDKQKAVADYKEALEKIKKGDLKIDFVKFRLDYTETDDYSPYGGGSLRKDMMVAINEKKYKDAIKLTDEMLETNYCDLNAHFAAFAAHTELNNKEKATFHLNVIKALMDAILLNDGLTAKTAMISIGISEQYFLMNILGFKNQSKDLIRKDGSIFDVHTSYNDETKETRKFWFNIDKVFGRF